MPTSTALRSYFVALAALAAIIIALFSGACSQKPASADQATLSAIQAQYDVQSRGYAAKDPQAALSVLSPDYEDMNAGTATKRPQYDKEITQLITIADKATLAVKVTGGTSDGNTATVIADRHLEISIKAPDTGKILKRAFDETDSDTWVKDPAKGWLKTRSVVTNSSEH